MKITDAMVDRAAGMLTAFAHPTGKRAVRNALEAALADVPESSNILPVRETHNLHDANRIAELEALSKDDAALLARGIHLLEQADARIAELEAQLARLGEPATDADVRTFEQAWAIAECDEMSKRAATEVRHLERVCTLAGVNAVLRERAKEST